MFIRKVSSYRLLSTLVNQLKLVYGPFGMSNMHSTLDFCPPDQPGRKLMYHYVHKRSYELTVLIHMLCEDAIDEAHLV